MPDLAIYFFIYAVLGWICEVCYAFYVHRRLINRGFVFGPLCPMYGAGMVLMLLLLKPLEDNWALMFIVAALVCSAIEWGTAWLLETVFKTRWWDYSDKPLNLGGYICLSFSLMWGAGATGVVLFLHPVVERLLSGVPVYIKLWLAGAAGVLFAADASMSIISALHLKDRMREMQAVLLDFAGDLEIQSFEGIKQALSGELTDIKRDLALRYESLQAKTSRLQRRLLKAYPRASTKRFREPLSDLYLKLGIRRERVRRKR